MRSFRLPLVAAGIGVLAGSSAARAQTEYPQTLQWGTGLVNIPAAYVPPLSGDFSITYTGQVFPQNPELTAVNSSRLNQQFNFMVSAFGRVEAGLTVLSFNPEVGGYAKALLLDEQQFGDQGGLGRFLIPSVAVGVRNIGAYDHIDRFGTGYELLPVPNGNYLHQADSAHQAFKTNNSVYGVLTKSISLSDIRPNWADVAFGLTLGYGNGIFKDHGNLPLAQYAQHSTGGWFYGVKTDFVPTANTTLTLMAENDAWDWNLGASVLYRGLRAAAYFTGVGAGSGTTTNSATGITTNLNSSKFAFALGWQSNIFALIHGQFLQTRYAELERRRQALLAEITRRQQRIAALELELNRYEAQNLLELEQRRAQAETELRQEREALRRLEDRLRRVESQSPAAPGSTTPPAGTPPTSPTTTPSTTPPGGTPPSTTPSTIPGSTTPPATLASPAVPTPAALR